MYLTELLYKKNHNVKVKLKFSEYMQNMGKKISGSKRFGKFVLIVTVTEVITEFEKLSLLIAAHIFNSKLKHFIN